MHPAPDRHPPRSAIARARANTHARRPPARGQSSGRWGPSPRPIAQGAALLQHPARPAQPVGGQPPGRWGVANAALAERARLLQGLAYHRGPGRPAETIFVGAGSPAKPLPARGSAPEHSPASRLLRGLAYPRGQGTRHPDHSVATSGDHRSSTVPLPATPRAHTRTPDHPVGAGSPAKPLPAQGSATGRSPASRLQQNPCLQSRVLHGRAA